MDIIPLNQVRIYLKILTKFGFYYYFIGIYRLIWFMFLKTILENSLKKDKEHHFGVL